MNLTDQERDNLRNAISYLLYSVRGDEERADVALSLFASANDAVEGLSMLAGAMANILDSIDGVSVENVLTNLASLAGSE